MAIMDHADIAPAILVVLIVALGAIVLRRVRPAIAGLVEEERNGGMAPERLQLLAIVLLIAAWYVWSAITMMSAGKTPTAMPDVPEWVLVTLLGSKSIFLGGKGVRRLWTKR